MEGGLGTHTPYSPEYQSPPRTPKPGMGPPSPGGPSLAARKRFKVAREVWLGSPSSPAIGVAEARSLRRRTGGGGVRPMRHEAPACRRPEELA